MLNCWMFKMAWRDSRGSRRQLALFLSSIVAGVAALVAISSFGTNLRGAVDEEAKGLLGADLVLRSGKPFTERIEAVIDSIGGEQSRRVSFASMAYFPSSQGVRLARVRAIEGGYPFYGTLKTTPAEAGDTYLSAGAALVEASLMKTFGTQPGDSVRIGRQGYRIAGQIDGAPGENQVAGLFSPRIYISTARLDSSLLGRGSRADYDVAFRFEGQRDVEALVEQIRPTLHAEDVGHDTVDEVRQDWDESLTGLYRFLGMVALVAVLLGGIGVASAIHVYVRRKFATIAVLRCLGARARRTFMVYAVQALVMGGFGGVAGAMLGMGVQVLVPFVLRDFIPVDVPFRIAWGAVGSGLALGLGTTAAFASLPLVSIRRVSPMLALRSSIIPEHRGIRDPLWWAVLGSIAVGLTATAMVNAPMPWIGLGYAVTLAIVFAILLGVARLITWTVWRFFPSGWAYTWRQGLANLFRPNNQTSMLMLSLGLGTFLIATLFGVQATLLGQIEVAGGAQRPNVVMFDIQPDQIEPLAQLVEDQSLPILSRVPIVSMRLSSVKGRTIEELAADSTTKATWAHWREYRSSYRDHLTESEEIVEGSFTTAMKAGDRLAPISLEEEIADDLGVVVGDTLTFDVQGLSVPTRVSSIRRVDWRRIGTNFFVIFPTGVLERAPQLFVLLSRTEGPDAAAALQRSVVHNFPAVSLIDISLVLGTFDAIFSRISFVVRFMASFSILTGLIVLIGAVVVSRVQRMRESVLLKTLGASVSQVIRIMIVEYLFLGFLAALTGLLLSFASGWAFATFVLDTGFRPDFLAVCMLLVVVPLLTVTIGIASSRGIYRRPPLDVLRADV